MASLNFDDLLTNITLNESIGIYVNKLFQTP